jgi:hypothetical protein
VPSSPPHPRLLLRTQKHISIPGNLRMAEKCAWPGHITWNSSPRISKEIVLYVMDHADQALSTVGGMGKATIQVGKAKAKTPIRLEPAGGNILKGTGDFAVTPETAVTVFVELPRQEVTAARFVPSKTKAKTKLVMKGDAKSQMENNSEEHHHHMQH